MRRPGRVDRRAPRSWILAGLDIDTITGSWRHDDDLLDAAASLDGDSVGTARSQPVVLVFLTHGVHDVCCALRGRAVAAALASRWPELVWECSHIGGDRFASNVVLLPDGFYYGNVDPASALATVEAHLAGTVFPDRLRGMARFLPPVQAAVIAAYQHYGTLAPSDVPYVQPSTSGRTTGTGRRHSLNWRSCHSEWWSGCTCSLSGVPKPG